MHHLVYNRAKRLKKGPTFHSVTLDFKKAFEKVPHSLLIQEIRQIDGIDQNICKWIQSFLTDKSQKVAIKGALFHSTAETSEVPGVNMVSHIHKRTPKRCVV